MRLAAIAGRLPEPGRFREDRSSCGVRDASGDEVLEQRRFDGALDISNSHAPTANGNPKDTFPETGQIVRALDPGEGDGSVGTT